MNHNYFNILYKKITDQLNLWEGTSIVLEWEVYLFLHSLKGTANTMGISDISNLCDAILHSIQENSNAPIQQEKLQQIKELFRRKINELDVDNKTQDRTPSYEANRNNETFILVIDQDIKFASNLKNLLESNGFPTMITSHAKKGLQLLYSIQPSLVLLDITSDEMNGFDLLKQVIKFTKTKFIPIIVMSEQSNIQNRVIAWNMGAMDFIAKPIQMELFIPFIKNRYSLQSSIVDSMLTDTLTGASNRRHFNESLSQVSSLSERYNRVFSLALIDLDKFKQINDTHGHVVGDEILKSFSDIVHQYKRASDLFFRYGGEEFALIFIDTTVEDAEAVIQNIREKFYKVKHTALNGSSFEVTFSAGLAPYNTNTEMLVSQADQALYWSKHSGRNQTTIYEEHKKTALRQIHIMVIDDDLLIRKILMKQLESIEIKGFEIVLHEYADGLKFVESDWYSASNYYLLLLDGIMPKMDGMEVLHHVRNNYPHKNVIVSMLTARSNESDILNALKTGADDYIIKPFTPTEVLARIERFISSFFI